MEQNKITRVFGISPEKLKESILTSVRSELKSFAQTFPIIPSQHLTLQGQS